LLKAVLFLQVVLLVLFLGAGYFIYIEVGAISSALEEAMGVIADIQDLLPKLDATTEVVTSLQGQFDEAFQTLNDLSLFLGGFFELLQQADSNS
jgi:ABC-type microcin C transport system permease subunit YejB|tara:strand:+ start:785 stop:1066 length:282 start_codon:yes stop_codon:yes gene_type:complete